MTTSEVQFREFRAGDEAAFRTLNEAWIVRHFALEAKDLETLANPRGAILDKDSRIFVAACDGEVVGCCALQAMGPSEFEVAKMTVSERERGAGIGRRMLEHVIAAAKAAGVRRLYLETNRKLVAAIRMYEAVGFKHLPSERVIPSPYARADVYMEMFLGKLL